MSNHCPRCGLRYRNDGISDPLRRSRDHILPQVWGGKDRIYGDTRNTVEICQTCNGFRAACGHCWAIAACVDAVAADRMVPREVIALAWKLGQKLRHLTLTRRDTTRRQNAEAVRIGRVVNQVGPDQFIFPADTAAKRVWNIATLAMGGYRAKEPEA